MAKKGKVGAILSAVLALVIVVAAAYVGIQWFQQNGDLGGNGKQTLSAPKNVAFDSENYLLTWDSVENASSYTVCYNDENIQIEKEKTNYAVLLSSAQNTFKIKANGDGVQYIDSAWSQTVNYTVQTPQELSLFEKINIEFNRAAKEENYILQRVIGISYADVGGNYINGNFNVETICKYEHSDKIRNIKLCYMINSASIKDLLSNVNEDTYCGCLKKEIVSYNSAQTLVDNLKRYTDGDNDAQMIDLYKQGYTISVIDSCVRKGKGTSKFGFEIVGTYKATLGDDVKYFTSINQVYVQDPSVDERFNYETCLEFKGEATVKETQFVMHEDGATLGYMKPLIDQKQANNN